MNALDYEESNEGKASSSSYTNSTTEAEITKLCKESFAEGKLNAKEFLDRVIELLISRLTIEKSTKEFMTFLLRYVKSLESRLVREDFKFYPKGRFEEDEDRYERKHPLSYTSLTIYVDRITLSPYGGNNQQL